MRLATVLYPAVLALAGTLIDQPPTTTVPYPDGYRAWTHVKSTVIGPTHKDFATQGGFQHIYANAEAMTGYRTRVFPEHSVVVFEWLEMTERDGAFAEGPRRQQCFACHAQMKKDDLVLSTYRR